MVGEPVLRATLAAELATPCRREGSCSGAYASAPYCGCPRVLRRQRVRGPRDAVWTRRDHALFVAFAPHDAPRYAIALIIQHAPSGGAADAAPKAREIMKTVLLKDPDMRARIERPLPPEAVAPAGADEGELGAGPGGEVTGAAPSDVAPAAPAPRRAPTATSGPRPYLAEPPQ